MSGLAWGSTFQHHDLGGERRTEKWGERKEEKAAALMEEKEKREEEGKIIEFHRQHLRFPKKSRKEKKGRTG